MKKLLFILAFFTPAILPAQNNPDLQFDSLHSRDQYRSRKWLVGSASVALYTGSLLVLNNAWYKDYPKTSFHSFDDSREWMQVDKVGHAWTAYNLSRASAASWNWAYGRSGQHADKATVWGSISGFTYLTVIEFLDAHSANWGWSWPDVGANFFGTSLYAGQQLAWNEQKISFKFSSHRINYPQELVGRADELYGNSLPERLLKDYNGQTYWLSANLSSVLQGGSLPKWLSIAIGYGAEGMYGGFQNLAVDHNGNMVFDRRDIKRYRQWYLAPDVDLTRIKTNSKFLKTILAGLNCIKFPAPALEFSNNKLRLRALVF